MIHKNWQELIRPTKLDIQPGRERRKVATMVAEPLERGFGTTLACLDKIVQGGAQERLGHLSVPSRFRTLVLSSSMTLI